MKAGRQKDFENQVIEKGNALLDEIFSDVALREKIEMEGPGEWCAGEITLSARYDKPEEFASLIKTIVKWLEDEQNWEKIENIMLI